ncbi:hypothetical protein RFI_14088 [Reticulomyxa filosa]|uniref:Uncharacterized protein n=1 Tax=Reticulomyxa filosa TaxID=46433 RepID=X6NCP8_RETFI|nr:hypothetical protein RFI_14088 [Reticulomyxa filosa]|eukprot:ETO23097.1 hypothetical protein RFI_14088 [Reticulomyxa filosa]
MSNRSTVTLGTPLVEQAYKDGGWTLCWLPDKDLLLTGGVDGTLKLWNYSTTVKDINEIKPETDEDAEMADRQQTIQRDLKLEKAIKIKAAPISDIRASTMKYGSGGGRGGVIINITCMNGHVLLYHLNLNTLDLKFISYIDMVNPLTSTHIERLNKSMADTNASTSENTSIKAEGGDTESKSSSQVTTNTKVIWQSTKLIEQAKNAIFDNTIISGGGCWRSDIHRDGHLLAAGDSYGQIFFYQMSQLMEESSIATPFPEFIVKSPKKK